MNHKFDLMNYFFSLDTKQHLTVNAAYNPLTTTYNHLQPQRTCLAGCPRLSATRLLLCAIPDQGTIGHPKPLSARRRGRWVSMSGVSL